MANGVYEHSRVLTGTLSALADNRTGPGATADVSRSISGVSLNVDCLLASCDAFGYRVPISRGRNRRRVVRLGVRTRGVAQAGRKCIGWRKEGRGRDFLPFFRVVRTRRSEGVRVAELASVLVQ